MTKTKQSKNAKRANVALTLRCALSYLDQSEQTGNDIYDEFAMASLLAGAKKLKEMLEDKKQTGQKTGQNVAPTRPNETQKELATR